MDFYSSKKEAQNCIERLLSSKKEMQIGEICLYITKKFGFGKLFVARYLELLESSGYIKIEGITLEITEKTAKWIEKNENETPKIQKN